MLFDRHPNGFYAGRGSFRYVDPIITSKSKRLLIVSPYISEEYFRLLSNVSRRKRVRVITAVNSFKQYENLKLKQKHALRKTFVFIPPLALALVSLIEFSSYHMIASWAFLIAVMITVVLIAHARFSHSSKLEVRMPMRGFVHEKLYISDNEAVMGSANLTHNGMHNNVEQIERVTDKAKITQLAEHFEELWASC